MRAVNKGLFLDLDGTIIRTKSGKTFPVTKDDWEFNGDILKRIEKYVDMGWTILIVTNQGGIEAGHVTMNDFRHKIRKIIGEIIVATGCPFSRIAYRFSISNNPDDFYRKPNPGMGYDLAITHILNLSESVMVGDASGKCRRREVVYKDESSPSNWSYKDGQYLAAVDIPRVMPDALGVTGMAEFYDHADSDKKFAQACGMKYIDIETFLKDQDNG